MIIQNVSHLETLEIVPKWYRAKVMNRGRNNFSSVYIVDVIETGVASAAVRVNEHVPKNAVVFHVAYFGTLQDWRDINGETQTPPTETLPIVSQDRYGSLRPGPGLFD